LFSQFERIVLIETSREYGRGLLRGIARYQQQFGPWSVFLRPHGLNEPAPKWLKKWKGDGILARINDRRMADTLLETGLPTVDLRGSFPNLGVPFIGVDNRPVAQLGFDHLRDCGVKHFAFCGTPEGENINQDFRRDHFAKLVRDAGYHCDICLGTGGPGRKANWEKDQQFLADWIKGLPKPVGMMTCHDDRGLQVLDACRRAGVSVPDEVAVIGVDNDTHLCNLCTPPLSSIDVQPSRIGYEAAAFLSRMMSGESVANEPVLIGPPRGVAARRSSELLSIEDPDVAAAIRLIRENATSGITVKEVQNQSNLSVSVLERRLKKALGRTTKAEITRVRMMRAKLLLTETGLPIARVARQSGFSEPKYFCEVFRKNEGMTATQFRGQFRNDGAKAPRSVSQNAPQSEG